MWYQVQWIGRSLNKKGTRVIQVKNIHNSYKTFEEAEQSIYDWWKKNRYEPPYVRMWKDGNKTIIDYGPHACFYRIVEKKFVPKEKRNNDDKYKGRQILQEY